MPIPLAVPIVAGVAVVGGVGLRLFQMSKKKLPPKVAQAAIAAPPPAAAPPAIAAPKTPPPATRIVPPTPAVIVAALPPLIQNPDGTPHTQATPFVFNTQSDAQSAVDEANRRGISVHQVLLERSGQVAPAGPTVSSVPGQQARVTTNDPAPSGDLIIRSGPSASASQIGGAEKNGTVTVLDASDPTFAKISWGGGSRLPAATGFARKAFLKLL